jgi:isoaspartyl peptidase/L-asparaginase-like protein (Ntn-hydrolase superfamily)
MINRRKFIQRSGLGALGLAAGSKVLQASTFLPRPDGPNKNGGIPMVISTWNHGYEANEAAWKVLQSGGRALDAVEAGVKVPEADPDNTSVGLGGFPDRDGHVTLDSCIMDEKGNCGSVTFLQHIKHPVSVARLVMEKTPHVMLSGEGALQFALDNGFSREDLLTEKARTAYEKWLEKSEYKPVINIENHDTIGMLAIDSNKDISGACTTSGAAYKMHGRVGDSPIIGAGLYVDNDVGAATATGMGELVMKTVGGFLIVELMRTGYTPQQACEEGIRRIADKVPGFEEFQIGYLAVSKTGQIGTYAIHKGFNYALFRDNEFMVIDSDYFIKDQKNE